MHLNQLDPQQAGRFQSTHSLFYDLADRRTVLQLSGIVDLNLRSPGWSNEASDAPPFRDDLQLDILLPGGFLAEGQHFVIEQSLPYVGLGSLVGVTNVSWGIEYFSLDVKAPIARTVSLFAGVVVARSGEILNNVSYAITLLGRRG